MTRSAPASSVPPQPAPNCALCPRLAGWRGDNRAAYPSYFNAPVPAFGDAAARLLIVGLAPGLHGANRTGRPFTGDFAGDLLYRTLADFGFANGDYGARRDDGLALAGARISNAVKCVPPQNKPLPVEIATCNHFLAAEIAKLEKLRIILALGHVAHGAALKALGLRPGAHPFAHGRRHRLGDGLALYDSYHCSRYNTNTRRLTPVMFGAVFAAIGAELAH
jgi:uracil-DNA glycosylase